MGPPIYEESFLEDTSTKVKRDYDQDRQGGGAGAETRIFAYQM